MFKKNNEECFLKGDVKMPSATARGIHYKLARNLRPSQGVMHALSSVRVEKPVLEGTPKFLEQSDRERIIELIKKREGKAPRRIRFEVLTVQGFYNALKLLGKNDLVRQFFEKREAAKKGRNRIMVEIKRRNRERRMQGHLQTDLKQANRIIAELDKALAHFEKQKAGVLAARVEGKLVLVFYKERNATEMEIGEAVKELIWLNNWLSKAGKA